MSNFLNTQVITPLQLENKLFFQTVTYGKSCLVTESDYIRLCDNAPEGFEYSLIVFGSVVSLVLISLGDD